MNFTCLTDKSLLLLKFICTESQMIVAKQHDKQFKLDAVQYYLDHKELGVRGCAQNL